jgi:hypothetical protein
LAIRKARGQANDCDHGDGYSGFALVCADRFRARAGLAIPQYALDAQLKPMTTPTVVPQPPYKEPPIIEAVIAMHFAVPIELKSIEAFALKRQARFPRNDDMLEMSTSFDTKTTRTASTMKKVGRKFHSPDGACVIVITPAQLAVIQRAPYTDWDTLCGEAREHWKCLTKIVKRRDVSRVSARYINRIDIPVDMNGHVDLHNRARNKWRDHWSDIENCISTGGSCPPSSLSRARTRSRAASAAKRSPAVPAPGSLPYTFRPTVSPRLRRTDCAAR